MNTCSIFQDTMYYFIGSNVKLIDSKMNVWYWLGNTDFGAIKNKLYSLLMRREEMPETETIISTQTCY